MRIFLCLIVTLLLTSCGSVYVDYDYDKSAAFESSTSYNYIFSEGNDWSEFDERRYMKSTDSLLQSRGWQQIEDPDIWITTTVQSYESSSRNTLGVGVGGGGGNVGVSVGGGIPVGGREENHELTIDFYDTKTKKYVWQAYAESAVKMKATPPQRDAYYQKVVSKVYSKYPPKI